MEGDPQEYDCETCAVAVLLDGLDADNREAWRVFGTVVCRLAVDVPGSIGPLLARIVEDKSPDDALDLWERLTIIYDIISPPPPTKT